MPKPTESPDQTPEDLTADEVTEAAAAWIPTAMRGTSSVLPATATPERDQLDGGERNVSAEAPERIETLAAPVVELGKAQAELAERQVEMLATLGDERKELRGEIEAEIDALRQALASQGRGLEGTVETIQGLQAGVIKNEKQNLAKIHDVLDDLVAQKPRIESLEESRSEAAARRREQEQEVENLIAAQETQRGGIVEKLTAIESRLAAESDRLAARVDAEERARRGSEERTAAVLDELRERLQVQSDRLTESEEGARERAAGFERSLDATIAGVRGEIDEAHKRADLVREELTTLADAVTAKLAEFGARLSSEQARVDDAIAAATPPVAPNVTSLRSTDPADAPRPVASLDTASFEDLRATGLSVTQAARLIAYRNSLGRPLVVADLDRVAGLHDQLRDALKQMLGG